MKVINNQDKVSKMVNDMKLDNVEAVGDDGSVYIQISSDNKAKVWDIAKAIEAKLSGIISVGDGVQEGSIWINCDELNIHNELSEVVNLF